MELEPFTAPVQAQLAAAAALGDERTRQVAGALAHAAQPAIRLAILGALTGLADEVTAALLDVPGAPAVSVRLDSDEVRVEVRSAAPEAPAHPDDGEASARISLRLSESLKSGVDAAAARDGVSVNPWLVRAASAALGGWNTSSTARRGDAHRITGWING
jgi:uncharacterized protein (DUF1778 family)